MVDYCVFTASLPPSVVATAATSIRKLMNGTDKRTHLIENSKRLHEGLKSLGFQLGTETPQSAIIAVIMPDLEHGAYHQFFNAGKRSLALDVDSAAGAGAVQDKVPRSRRASAAKVPRSGGPFVAPA